MVDLAKKRLLTKSEKQQRREKTVSFIILAALCTVWVLPLLYMIGTSFKSPSDLINHPENMFPTTLNDWTIEHYAGFIVREGKIDNMPLWMLNSLWSTAVTVILTVLLDLLTAYAVVFFEFKGKKIFMKFLVLWMAVPSVIGTAPSFALYSSLLNSLNDAGITTNDTVRYLYTYMWIIVPGVTGIFNFLLMRNFFVSIPKDIIDSAKSDGASHNNIFFKIVCPLAKSTILLIVLFTFTGAWNSLLFPQLILTGESSYWSTVTVALTGYTGDNAWGAAGVKMATSVFASIPILIVFIITQNKMIDGLATTGVKG